MITTDSNFSIETLEAILAKDSMINVDIHDVRKMFGEEPKLRMIKVVGSDIDEVTAVVKEEFASIGGCPRNIFSAYKSMILKMSDLERLSEITDVADRSMRTIIFEKDPDGEIALYYFFV